MNGAVGCGVSTPPRAGSRAMRARASFRSSSYTKGSKSADACESPFASASRSSVTSCRAAVDGGGVAALWDDSSLADSSTGRPGKKSGDRLATATAIVAWIGVGSNRFPTSVVNPTSAFPSAARREGPAIPVRSYRSQSEDPAPPHPRTRHCRPRTRRRFPRGAQCTQATLLAPDRQSSDFFGDALAGYLDVSQSLPRVMNRAGADDTAAGLNAGSVHTFGRINNQWGPLSQFVASDGQPNDFFGTSVACSDPYAVIGCDRRGRQRRRVLLRTLRAGLGPAQFVPPAGRSAPTSAARSRSMGSGPWSARPSATSTPGPTTALRTPTPARFGSSAATPTARGPTRRPRTSRSPAFSPGRPTAISSARRSR